MRTTFQEQLARMEERIEVSVGIAVVALRDMAETVSDIAIGVSPSIETAAGNIRRSYRDLNEEIIATIACQAPVAGDLRLMLALIEIAHHTGMIANQFDLIHRQLIDIDLHPCGRHRTGVELRRMAELAAAELTTAATALKQRDTDLAQRLAVDDQALNQLNREVFTATLLAGEDHHAREVSMRHVLIARSLERIGDNAVDIAEQALFLVTGQPCELTDASHPRSQRGS